MKCAKNANSAIVYVGALRPLNIVTNTHDGLGVLDGLEVGWGPKISAVRITHCPSAGRAPIKKRLPPSPLWSPCDSAARNASDRPVDYLSVCRMRAGPKLPCVFMRSAFALGFGIARRVPLGWQTARAVTLAPIPCDGSGAARWRD